MKKRRNEGSNIDESTDECVETVLQMTIVLKFVINGRVPIIGRDWTAISRRVT